jgi:phenylalanyl-tRNA synthetase beta chain
LTEAITWSLVSEMALARCGMPPDAAVRLANPLSQDHAFVRPSLLPGLLQAVRHNLSHEAAQVGVFEVGAVMTAGAREEMRLGIALAGWWQRDWRKADKVDFWVLKGLVDALIGRLCRSPGAWRNADAAWTQSGQGAAVELEGRQAGVAGQVSAALLSAWDIDEPVYFAECSFEPLLSARRAPAAAKAPTAFPPVKRDLSLLVSQETHFEAVASLIRETAGPLAHVELIDRFTKGSQVPAGRYSLTFSIEYRDPAKTLTAAEADARHQRIGQTLVSRLGATLR